jgi:hypothetical protein
MQTAGKAHAGIASGVNNAVARVAGLLAVAGLSAVLFASFSLHLAGPERAQANDALNAVMSGEPTVKAEVIAAFEQSMRAIVLITASSAAVAGVAGWLWIENGVLARGTFRQDTAD